MSVLAALLVAVGLADLVRSALRDRPGGTAITPVATAAGVVALTATAALSGLLAAPGGLLLTALAAIGLAAWVITSEGALSRGRHHLVPLAVLAGGLLLQLLTNGAAPDAAGLLSRWLGWADLPWRPQPDRALLLAGLALTQLSTGNLVVRHVLTSTGAMSSRPVPRGRPADEELKGGRLLGPLERLFILGLGLAGEYTAAGLVIAAKGLIRWPELRSHSESTDGPPDIDKVTEYFLVGSFVSWLVALSALVLAR